MRGWVMIIATFGAIFALCWYGATGETGPIGWLNSWQNGNTGHYSRALSFGLLCVAGVVIALPFMAVRAVAVQKARARTGVTPPPVTAAADAKVAAMTVAMTDRSRWRWRMYLKIWLVGLALVWISVLGWHAWDYHRRASDAGDAYTPLRLSRTTTVPRPDDGSHFALQGRLLWDHSVTQTTKDRVQTMKTAYVPVGGADWRPGDAIQFVVRLPGTEAWGLQHRVGGTEAPDAPLLVRVSGPLPTPSRAVFQQAEAPAIEDAVLVEIVPSSAGQVSESNPSFDWAQARLIGAAISATWTAGIWLGALGVLLQVWKARRRQARQALRQAA